MAPYEAAVNFKWEFYLSCASSIRVKLAVFCLLVLMPWLALAQGLPKPLGPVVLKISGNITQTNAAGLAEFDAAMLDALPVSQIVTATPWQQGVVTFSGPSLKALLNAVGAQGKMLRAMGLDDYAVQIPLDDVAQFNPVLSRRMNGVVLKVRDRGPLFLIYPFDDVPALKAELYYTRSIWHLTRIVVE